MEGKEQREEKMKKLQEENEQRMSDLLKARDAKYDEFMKNSFDAFLLPLEKLYAKYSSRVRGGRARGWSWRASSSASLSSAIARFLSISAVLAPPASGAVPPARSRRALA